VHALLVAVFSQCAGTRAAQHIRMFRNFRMRLSDVICILEHCNRFHPMHQQGNWLNRVLHIPRMASLGLGEDL
jgi:hypothetical protein